MGNQTLMERFKDFIGSVAWKVFLWSINMTDKEYIRRIVEESIFDRMVDESIFEKENRDDLSKM